MCASHSGTPTSELTWACPWPICICIQVCAPQLHFPPPCARHPNCVSIIGIVASPPCLVTEYCELGCLTSLLWAAREDPEKAATLTWSRRLAIVSFAEDQHNLHPGC